MRSGSARCWMMRYLRPGRQQQSCHPGYDPIADIGVSCEPVDMPSIEVIATLASTVMSTVVAIVALIFTYRQNVGWQPVALVTNTWLKGTGGKWHYTLHLSVEVWNRHKFPIALRHATANISGVDILDADPTSPDSRNFIRNNKAHTELKSMVAPNDSEIMEFSVSFENQSLDALRPHFEITISFFTPHQNRADTLKIEHKFFYPDLGWGKTEAERVAALTAFQSIARDNSALVASKRENGHLRRTTKTLTGNESSQKSE